MKTDIPSSILLGVSYEGLHVIEPKKKQILTSIFGAEILEIKVFPTYVMVSVETGFQDEI